MRSRSRVPQDPNAQRGYVSDPTDPEDDMMTQRSRVPTGRYNAYDRSPKMGRMQNSGQPQEQKGERNNSGSARKSGES